MSTTNWDEFTPVGPDGKPQEKKPTAVDWSQFTPVKPAGFMRRAADQGIKLAQGVVGVPETAVGIADLVTGGWAGKAAEDAGVRFKEAKQILGDQLSPEQKAADAEVNDAKGFFSTVGAMVKNPSTILGATMESTPSMLTGGVAARGLMKVAPALSSIVAGAAGEGIVAAGQSAEQIRQEDPSGTLTPQQSALAAASGAATGLIGFGAGKLANKLGIGDVETMLAAGKLGAVGKEATDAAAKKGIARKIGEGFASEGVLQELPQSYQEQVAQNLALGKPWDEGAAEAGAQGMMAGGLMGAGGNLASHFAENKGPDPTGAPGATPPPAAPGTPPATPTGPADQNLGFKPGAAAKPSESMGLDPAAGPMSAAAALAVDTAAARQPMGESLTGTDNATMLQRAAQGNSPLQEAIKDRTSDPFSGVTIPEGAASEADRRAYEEAFNRPAPTEFLTLSPDERKSILYGNKEVNDGGQQFTGTKDGDILNGMGTPFKTRFAAARRAHMMGKEWGIEPVADGFVARWKGQENAEEKAQPVSVLDPAGAGAGPADEKTTSQADRRTGQGDRPDGGRVPAGAVGEPGQPAAGSGAGSLQGAVAATTSLQKPAPQPAQQKTGQPAESVAPASPGQDQKNPSQPLGTGQPAPGTPEVDTGMGKPGQVANGDSQSGAPSANSTPGSAAVQANGEMQAPATQMQAPATNTQGVPANVPQPAQPGTQASKTPSAQGAAPAGTVAPEKQRALDRIASGKAWFGNAIKAQQFIHQNGLKGTHEAVKSGDKRWDVRAVAAADTAVAQPAQAAQVAQTPSVQPPGATREPQADQALQATPQRPQESAAPALPAATPDEVRVGDKSAISKFKPGDKVQWVQSGEFTSTDGSKTVDPVRTGVVEKIEDKEQGRVRVKNDKGGWLTIGAASLSHQDNAPASTPELQAQQAEAQRQEAPAAAGELGRFESDGVGRSEAEKELQAQSHKEEQPGDVLMDDGSFVAFDVVVAMAKEGIAAGAIRPAPAQMHFKLDMSMRDANRVLDAATKPADQAPGEALQSAMGSAGWAAEVAGAGNTIWTKRTKKDRYTAILTPESNSMEITVLVDTVDTQIASFKVADPKDAAIAANKAVADDMAESATVSTPVAVAKPEQTRTAIEHAGLKIYPIKVKMGNAVVEKWAVQTPDNAQREKNGERQIGGDPLSETLDGAKKNAEAEVRDAKSRAEREAESKAADDAAQAKKDANKGKSILQRRAVALLDKQHTYPPQAGLGQGTRREAMQKAVDQGRAIVERMVPDTAAKHRDQTAIDLVKARGYILGLSNENIPVVKQGLEAQARMKANQYEKPEYRVYDSAKTDGGFYEITKTEFDYAKSLAEKANKTGNPESPEQYKSHSIYTPSMGNGFMVRDLKPSGKAFGDFVAGPFATKEQARSAVDSRAGSPTSAKATHQDPGAAPESATAPVIAESLQKAAKKEERPLAEMKAELLGMIDAAIKETPNYKDYLDAVTKFGKDSAEQMYARKDRPMGSDTVEGKGSITFDVPGDGKFRVTNSFTGLSVFRAKIAKASGNGFSETKRPGLPASTSVKKGSTNQISAIESMLEDGDLQAAKDYMTAVGIGTDGMSKSALARMEQLESLGDKAQEALYTRIDPEWQYSVDRGSRRATLIRTIGKDVYRAHVLSGTNNKNMPDDFNTATYGISKNGEKDEPGSARNFHDALVMVQTALEAKSESQDALASKAKDTGWNMAGTGYAGKRYSGRNMTLEDGREVVARIYENAGVYDEAEVKVDGKRVFAVTDREDAQGKADDFIKTLMGERSESVEAFKSWYNRSGHEIYPSKKAALAKWMKDGIEGLYDMPGDADPTPYLKDWLAKDSAPAELNLMGFTKTPTGNGTFTLSDSNMRVTVEPTGTGFQARMGSAKSGPRLTEQESIEWASALRDESIRIQKAETKAKPEVSKTGKLPVFPVDAYRLERFYANGAKIKPLPARTFGLQEIQSITDWFKSIGWSVTSGSGGNGINATNDIGMTIDDLPEPYTAAQRKKDEALLASDERAAAKKKEQEGYLASTAAGKFVAGMFGDAMNRSNQVALAKVLSGDEKTFAGLFSNSAVDVLSEAGISAEGREIKDVIRDIKAMFDTAPTSSAKEPWQMTEAEFGEVERLKALANIKYDLERAKNGSLKPFVSGDKSKPALVRRLTAEVAQIESAKPEGYAGDHLAQINKALREGKPVPEVNLKRYDIAEPATPEQKAPANTGNAGAVVSQDEFPLDEATRSYDGISQHSATRARSDRDQFVKAIQDEYDAAEKVAETPEQRAVLESEAQSLKADYLSRYKQMMGVRSGAYSGFFVGRANLNVKQADKRNDALTRANETFDNWLTENTGRIKSAVLKARNADQLAAVQAAKDAKAADKERRDLALMGKILAFKSGDDLRFGTAIVTRVSLDKDGYPNTITVKSSDGTPLTNDKINLASEIFGGRGIRGIQGGKQEIRRLADIVRLGAWNTAEEGQNGSQAKTLIESEQDLWTRISDGAASVDEFKAGFENWMKNKAAILAELTAQKKDDLLARISPFMRNRYKSETKQDVAEALWRDSLGTYSLNSSVSYGMGSDSYENAVRRMVEATDAARLAQYADEVKSQREEMDQRRADKVKAIADPKTLDDYTALVIAKAKEAGVKTMREARMLLTPEQRAMFDDLAADKSRKDRNHTQEVKQSVRVAGQTVDAIIIETKHTQKGHDLFVVTLAERVERSDYDTLNASAKKMGGYYSSFRGRGAEPGFQFTDRATAEAFVKLANGDSTDAQATVDERRDAFADDRSQSAAERLTEMADRLDAQADESLNADRKTNTARRAGFASAAEAAARAGKAVAKTMRNIAQALSDGTAKYLDRIRTKTQIDALQGYIGTAQYEQLKSKYPTYAEQEKRKGQPPDMETADFAEFPQFTAYRSDLASLARQMIAADGTKLLGQRLLKVADDVSDAFNKFAKENTGKLMRFRTKDGGVAAFPSQASTQAAIDRSGFKGKAIPFMVKRGEWTIITSPSEAITQGLWGGDGDKRITLTADFGSELVEKIGKANRRGAKVSVPWQFESSHDKRKMLARMGIETPAEFRAALREFIGLREQAAEADRVKMLERAMIGRRNDGLDFFPTPESVADEMIAAADIQPDMAVLEPSAGFGHIADRIRAAGAEPDVIELSSDRKELLEEKGFTVVGSDFMDMTPRGFTYGDVFKHDDGRLGILGSNGGLGSGRYRFIPLDGDARTFTWEDRDALTGFEKRGSSSGYDRILMNPPFSDGRDMEHVQHAYTLLKPGGRLVALMGESAFTNQNKRATEFRAWLEQVGGTEEKLAEGSFMDPSLPVNTGANARMVVIEKPTGNDTDVVFSRGTPFYSELSRQIEAANINTAPVIGWKAALKGLQSKGVKADEITWSGIEEWLDLQTGKVTKASVLDFLAANGVQVEEVTLGESKSGVDEWEVVRNGPEDYDVVDGAGDVVEAGFLARSTAQEFIDSEAKKDGTKYSQYTLPGGERYREVLLTLPSDVAPQDRGTAYAKDHTNDYQSSHWSQPNVLAHIRVNDRADADGRRVLFVEEIQSDWGQAGKREGFASVKHTTINALNGNVKEYATEEEARAAASAPGTALQYRADRIDGPPLAPFVDKTDKWLTLSLKRIVKMAVDGGYDRVAFVNGEQSAARYDLSKEVKNIEWTQYGSGTKVLSINPKSGNAIEVLVEEDGTTASVSGRDAEFAGKPLSDVVGKEIAEKIMAQRSGDLRGDGLKVGGEGMKAFYDQIVPSATKALLKRLGGGQMESVNINADVKTRTAKEERAYIDEHGSLPDDYYIDKLTQPGFTITPAMQEKASNGLPLFRRQLAKFSRGAQKQANNAVQSTVDKLTADWQNKPEIVIAFDMQDEAIPDNVRLEDAKQRSGGAFGNPEGFYYRGVVYLLSSQLATDADIARVLAHESLGHYGLRGLYGKALKPILQQIATMRRADVIAVARQRGLVKVDGNNRPIVDVKTATNAQVWAAMTDSHKSQSAEEVLAEMAQTTPQAGFVKRAVAAIRQWLREHGVNLKLTDNDIIVNYILPARGWVERGPGGGGGPRGGLAFSRGAKGAMSNSQVGSAFKAMVKQARSDLEGVLFNWQEVELNEDGDRMVSRPGRDRFYSKGKEGGAVSVTKRSFIEWLQSEGPFDTKIYGPDIAKDAEWAQQIKTLRGLIQGEQNGPEVRFSRATTARDLTKKATEAVRVFTNTPGKVNWWHKTIGTQYNLAQRSPEFKRVYDAVQDFIGDVSFYATEAADLAPKILPKLETWRDIAKSPVSGEDTRAIAAPIFEGTLIWARDESGRPVKVKQLEDEAALMSSDRKAQRLLRNDKISEGVLKMWRGLPMEQYEALIDGKYEKEMLKGGLVWSDAELKSQFNLNDGQIALYHEFRASTDKSLTNLAISDMLYFGGKDVAPIKEAVLDAKTVDEAAEMLRDYLMSLANDELSSGVDMGSLKAALDEARGLNEQADALEAGAGGRSSKAVRALESEISAKSDLAVSRGKAGDMPGADKIMAEVAKLEKQLESAKRSANGYAFIKAKELREKAKEITDEAFGKAPTPSKKHASLIATANKMIDKGDRVSDLMARGYAPLSRFGTYTLDVVDADGERVYFGLFESRFEADRMAKQMAVEYPGSTVEQGTLSEESYKLFAGVSPETVALFGDMLGLEDNGAYQDYLKLAKSTRSAMKRLIERKGIAGFSGDAGRVLAGFVYSNARQTSQNLHTGEMVQAANDIPKGMGELKDKATQLVEYIKNPVEEAQRIRGLLFAQYIGGSVASAMVNMTQPLTMTLPWLTQFGGLSKASKQMAAAVKDATRKTTGDKALDAALKRGEEDGTVSPQEVHDLMRQAQGKGALKSGDGTKLGNAAAAAQNVVSRIGFGWGKLFSTAEQFNRRATFIAAYRTAVEQGMKNPDAFARRAIHETQGVYNKGNKPDWARGAVGSTLFTFKQYSVAYVEMMHRMATQGGPEGRRAALYGLAILMLLSGAGGAPGADDLDDIISGAMQALGYNFDSKAARRRFLSEHLGDGGADFVERGVSGLPGVPIDVSGRLGLGNLIPGTGLLTRKQDHTRDVMEIAGPAGDLFARAFEASGKLLKGNIGGHAGAVATIAPKAVSNLFQAADMAETGMYRDKNGNKVIETDAGDAAVKALGFQPNAVKRVQESSIEVQRMALLNRIREKEIADKWAKGLFEKDQDKVQEAMDDMKRWNEDNPETPIRINFAQIRSRLHTMNLSKSERIAKTAPSELRMQVRQALEAQ